VELIEVEKENVTTPEPEKEESAINAHIWGKR